MIGLPHVRIGTVCSTPKVCRYLCKSTKLDNEFYCLKDYQHLKALVDAEFNKYEATIGIKPTDIVLPTGDNCQGFLVEAMEGS